MQNKTQEPDKMYFEAVPVSELPEIDKSFECNWSIDTIGIDKDGWPIKLFYDYNKKCWVNMQGHAVPPPKFYLRPISLVERDRKIASDAWEAGIAYHRDTSCAIVLNPATNKEQFIQSLFK